MATKFNLRTFPESSVNVRVSLTYLLNSAASYVENEANELRNGLRIYEA